MHGVLVERVVAAFATHDRECCCNVTVVRTASGTGTNAWATEVANITANKPEAIIVRVKVKLMRLGDWRYARGFMNVHTYAMGC